MNMLDFSFAGLDLQALPSGALWWPDVRRLLVADLHLGKSERLARRGGALLPPYEVAETLSRLEQDIAATDPVEVICLGDSFDDALCATHLGGSEKAQLDRLQAARSLVWVTGNHDPHLGTATSVDEVTIEGIVLRHIAQPGPMPAGIRGEVSGHFHPKHHVATRGGRVSRRCFLVTPTRLILPAYGAYTGGLALSDRAFVPFLTRDSRAILLGERPILVPLETGRATA